MILYPLFAAIWLVVWLLNFILNLDYYTRPGHEIELIMHLVMIAIGIILLVVLIMYEYGTKIIGKLSPSSRCPSCYAKRTNGAFCEKCGEVFNQEAITNVSKCPCGYVSTDPDKEFCPECGRPFKR